VTRIIASYALVLWFEYGLKDYYYTIMLYNKIAS
jgi:hypothetical protein